MNDSSRTCAHSQSEKSDIHVQNSRFPTRTPLADPYVQQVERYCRAIFRFQTSGGPQPDDGLTDAEVEEANRANSSAIIAEIQALMTGRSGR